MSATDLQILPGSPRRGVNVAMLERDWEALWRAPGADGREAATMQVRTLNLIVPALAADEAWVIERLNPALLSRPSRAIVLLHDSTAMNGLTSRATGICRLTGGPDLRLCCEEATIEASADVPPERMVQAVTPLILPDLPTFLWWKHDLPVAGDRQALFDGLAALSQRVIVDSAHSRDARAAVEQIATWVTSRPFRLSDWNWARLTPWRELTARLFDPPRCREQMRRIRRLRIDCIAGEDIGAQTLAMLYVGWLASRLQWQVTAVGIQPDELEATFAGGDDVVEVRLGTRCGETTGLRKVHFETDKAQFQIWLSEKDAMLRAESLLGGERKPVHAVPFAAQDDAALLAEELDLVGRDQIFEQTVRKAAEILAFAQ